MCRAAAAVRETTRAAERPVNVQVGEEFEEVVRKINQDGVAIFSRPAARPRTVGLD